MIFKNLSEYLNFGEIITQDSVASKIYNNENFYFTKRDFLFRYGSWRNKEFEPLIFKLIKKHQNRKVLLSHSDISTKTYQSIILKLFGIIKIYGSNVYPVKNLSEPIPIGLTNDCDDSKLHRLFGDLNLLARAESTEFINNFNFSIYCNFTVTNNKKERLSILKNLSSLSSFKYSTPEFTPNARLKFLENLRLNNFVVCPSGNGIDTHRIWETLYMGGIPIIRSNKVLNFLVADLPVLIVKNWSELKNEKLMEEKWHQIVMDSTHNFEKLKLSHWTNKILAE